MGRPVLLERILALSINLCLLQLHYPRSQSPPSTLTCTPGMHTQISQGMYVPRYSNCTVHVTGPYFELTQTPLGCLSMHSRLKYL